MVSALVWLLTRLVLTIGTNLLVVLTAQRLKIRVKGIGVSVILRKGRTKMSLNSDWWRSATVGIRCNDPNILFIVISSACSFTGVCTISEGDRSICVFAFESKLMIYYISFSRKRKGQMKENELAYKR